MDLQKELSKIADTHFFENMGKITIQHESVIMIKNVENAFIHPQKLAFQGVYDQMKWLPTSFSDLDPFYVVPPKIPEPLQQARKQITQALMRSTRDLTPDFFQFECHNFQHAAKQALYFTFRQLMLERYFTYGDRWEKIAQLYYAGHWVIGYYEDRYIVI